MRGGASCQGPYSVCFRVGTGVALSAAGGVRQASPNDGAAHPLNDKQLLLLLLIIILPPYYYIIRRIDYIVYYYNYL